MKPTQLANHINRALRAVPHAWSEVHGRTAWLFVVEHGETVRFNASKYGRAALAMHLADVIQAYERASKAIEDALRAPTCSTCGRSLDCAVCADAFGGVEVSK